MKKLFVLLAVGLPIFAQQQIRWSATTGNVSQTGSAYTATLQQPQTNQQQVLIDVIQVYCSAACTITQNANGTAATATAGTVQPILPSPLTNPPTVNFFTASNVGTGSIQGGVVNLPAGATVTLCLGTLCNAGTGQVTLPTGGSGINYSVTIGAMTGTSNITFFGRSY